MGGIWRVRMVGSMSIRRMDRGVGRNVGVKTLFSLATIDTLRLMNHYLLPRYARGRREHRRACPFTSEFRVILNRRLFRKRRPPTKKPTSIFKKPRTPVTLQRFSLPSLCPCLYQPSPSVKHVHLTCLSSSTTSEAQSRSSTWCLPHTPTRPRSKLPAAPSRRCLAACRPTSRASVPRRRRST